MVRAVGLTWGDPWSVRTYSGYPWQVFRELDKSQTLVSRVDCSRTRVSDRLTGFYDIRRSFRAMRPRESSLWRYLPETIERLTLRYREVQRRLPEHEVSLQFG